ncbi:MAG: aldehyde dehydrogenase family protein [Deltaproteobacteria bacterium]|nr:aldehyde dehydrogenase family protein [Deltaproteobacteria bacterium]
MAEPGSTNPATGAALEPIAATPLSEVAEVVARARRAQPGWGKASLEDRSERAIELSRRILERRSEIVKLLSDETGRDETECLMSEVASAMEYAKAAVKVARKALAKELLDISALDYPGKSGFIEAVPRGVIGIIAPWNYPLGNFMKSIFPALLSGNAVVLKPSEHTPRSGAWLRAICESVFPRDLVGLVVGRGDAGELLARQVDAIVFTGSVRTGKRVALIAAERLIPCSLELGGKDAAIVLEDCDLPRTLAGVLQWGMHNAGQNCAGIERVYVVEPIADRFVTRLGEMAKQLRVAPGEGPTDLGPLQNEAQLSIVERHVAEAIQKGATLVVGGKPTGRGLGYEPTILDRCNEDMAVVREETFGPVLAVCRVKDAEEAIRRANDSSYGLNGSVWTKDLARGLELARRLEVGVSLVNNHSICGIMADAAWTGTKDTGPGIAASRFAYSNFVRRRTVLIDKAKAPDPWWMPASPELAAFGAALVQRSIGSKLGALAKLAGLVGKRTKTIQALASGKS